VTEYDWLLLTFGVWFRRCLCFIDNSFHIKLPSLELFVTHNLFIVSKFPIGMACLPFLFLLTISKILTSKIKVFGHCPFASENLSHHKVFLMINFVRAWVPKLSRVNIALLLLVEIEERQGVIVVWWAILTHVISILDVGLCLLSRTNE